MLPAFAYARPETLDDALELLSEDQVPVCGGTELLLAMRAGLYRPTALVDLKRVPDLNTVTQDSDHLVVGATCSHFAVAGHPLVRRLVPMLARVEERVGNARVRAQGSVGGNLCFAEPKSDLATALIALGAVVTLVSPGGRRTVSVEEFVVGPYFADREPDELLLDVRVPLADARSCAYVKFQVAERPTVGVAVVEDLTAGTCRVVVGAVGDVPMSREYTSADVVDVDALVHELDPVQDLTGSVDYKRHVSAVFVRRALDELTRSRDHE